ncbi:hypothetical protein GALMADRAFT_231731 [Galerina marginata CBS 339.88]|uniref:Uncharacterized protein n=1 Tax=Galerina marginata (strain CBS 339.88) TaxID=685588 RepID=A0A067SAD9_GALM3|nr:hypothetical protein GALMADRAFT_231731 [Galerina marginata CBS 339.88]
MNTQNLSATSTSSMYPISPLALDGATSRSVLLTDWSTDVHVIAASILRLGRRILTSSDCITGGGWSALFLPQCLSVLSYGINMSSTS